MTKELIEQIDRLIEQTEPDPYLTKIAKKIVGAIDEYDQSRKFVKVSEKTNDAVEILHKQTKVKMLKGQPEPYYKYIIRQSRQGQPSLVTQLLSQDHSSKVVDQTASPIPKNILDMRDTKVYEFATNDGARLLTKHFDHKEPHEMNRGSYRH